MLYKKKIYEVIWWRLEKSVKEYLDTLHVIVLCTICKCVSKSYQRATDSTT